MQPTASLNSDVSDCLIIGSGPSGTACAEALLKHGRAVYMLDAGLSIEPERAEAVRAARARVDVLRPETAPWLQAPSTEAATSIPRKLLFGSDFPYREASAHLRLHSEAVELEPSFAFGGHSNIWGAAVMPYVDRDMAGWPICARELAPHYEACARMLEFSAEEDDLAEEFPLYSTPPGEVAASSQARSLLHTMARNRVRLAAPITSFSRRPHRSTCWQGMALHTLSRNLHGKKSSTKTWVTVQPTCRSIRTILCSRPRERRRIEVVGIGPPATNTLLALKASGA